MSQEKEVTRILMQPYRSDGDGWTISELPIVERFSFRWPFVHRFKFHLTDIKVELDQGKAELTLNFWIGCSNWDHDMPQCEPTRRLEQLVRDLLDEGLFSEVRWGGYATTIFRFDLVSGEKFTEAAIKRVYKLIKTLFGRNAVDHLTRPNIHRVTRRWVGGQWLDYGDVVYYKLKGIHANEAF